MLEDHVCCCTATQSRLPLFRQRKRNTREETVVMAWSAGFYYGHAQGLSFCIMHADFKCGYTSFSHPSAKIYSTCRHFLSHGGEICIQTALDFQTKYMQSHKATKISGQTPASVFWLWIQSLVLRICCLLCCLCRNRLWPRKVIGTTQQKDKLFWRDTSVMCFFVIAQQAKTRFNGISLSFSVQYNDCVFHSAGSDFLFWPKHTT